MTISNYDATQTPNDGKESDHLPQQSDLGWEGHVHFPDGIPLWRRVLESWPELRTGLAYSLVFGAGVVLGSLVTNMFECKEEKSEG